MVVKQIMSSLGEWGFIVRFCGREEKNSANISLGVCGCICVCLDDKMEKMVSKF